MDERRREPRVRQPYLIHFRQVNPPPLSNEWDIASALNISKTGICFNCTKHYRSGVELEIKISNPLTQTKGVYRCTVVRSDDFNVSRKLYKTVVKLEALDDSAREALYKSIDQYIRKYRDQHPY